MKAEGAPFAVFTRDRLVDFLYLSPSAQHILDRSIDELLQLSLLEFLSDALATIRYAPSGTPNLRRKNNAFMVETLGNQGALLRLDVSETAITSEGHVIGFVGFIKRAEHTETSHPADIEIDDRELMQRAASLSSVERQVAELVVDGHMNKRMANLLAVAIRTIETRRARVMSKMRAKSCRTLFRCGSESAKSKRKQESQAIQIDASRLVHDA